MVGRRALVAAATVGTATSVAWHEADGSEAEMSADGPTALSGVGPTVSSGVGPTANFGAGR